MIQLTEPHEIVYWNFSQNWRNYEACLGQCQKSPKSKPVHELRTTLRRLVATLDVLLALQPSLQICKLRKELKKGLDSTRELRDFQSQEKSLENYDLPVLQEFRSDIQGVKTINRSLRTHC